MLANSVSVRVEKDAILALLITKIDPALPVPLHLKKKSIGR